MLPTYTLSNADLPDLARAWSQLQPDRCQQLEDGSIYVVSFWPTTTAGLNLLAEHPAPDDLARWLWAAIAATRAMKWKFHLSDVDEGHCQATIETPTFSQTRQGENLAVTLVAVLVEVLKATQH